MDTVRISAVVCTHNRAPYLRKALASLATQSLPPARYEVLVIDNCSTDETRTLVNDEFGGLPNVRYIFEPRLGLSHARNTGWQQARGLFVAYLDDDAIATPGWLARIVAAFETVRPTPGCVGGKTSPIWEGPRPAWLGDTLLHHLSIIDWSAAPLMLGERQWLVGANIAFVRPLLAALGGFEPNLGRKGSRLASMEEVPLERALAQRGFGAYYDPAIEVGHHVHPSRLSTRWFVRRAFWGGASKALAELSAQPLGPGARVRRVGSPLRYLLHSPRRLGSLVVPTSHPQRFASKYTAFAQVGYIAAMLGVVR